MARLQQYTAMETTTPTTGTTIATTTRPATLVTAPAFTFGLGEGSVNGVGAMWMLLLVGVLGRVPVPEIGQYQT